MRFLIYWSGAFAFAVFVIGLTVSAFIRNVPWADRLTFLGLLSAIVSVAVLFLSARDSARHSSTIRKVRAYLLAGPETTDEQFMSARPYDDAQLLVETREAISRFFDVPSVKVGRDVHLLHDLHVDELEPFFQFSVVRAVVASHSSLSRWFWFSMTGLVSIDDLARAIRRVLDSFASTDHPQSPPLADRPGRGGLGPSTG